MSSFESHFLKKIILIILVWFLKKSVLNYERLKFFCMEAHISIFFVNRFLHYLHSEHCCSSREAVLSLHVATWVCFFTLAEKIIFFLIVTFSMYFFMTIWFLKNLISVKIFVNKYKTEHNRAQFELVVVFWLWNLKLKKNFF